MSDFRRRFGLGATRIGSPSEVGGTADVKLDAFRHGFLGEGEDKQWLTSVDNGSLMGLSVRWGERSNISTRTLDADYMYVNELQCLSA